jgi:hypothetical protein
MGLALRWLFVTLVGLLAAVAVGERPEVVLYLLVFLAGVTGVAGPNRWGQGPTGRA